jgi:hypothetical protein
MPYYLLLRWISNNRKDYCTSIYHCIKGTDCYIKIKTNPRNLEFQTLLRTHNEFQCRCLEHNKYIWEREQEGEYMTTAWHSWQDNCWDVMEVDCKTEMYMPSECYASRWNDLIGGVSTTFSVHVCPDFFAQYYSHKLKALQQKVMYTLSTTTLTSSENCTKTVLTFYRSPN